MLSEKITDALASTKALAADYRIILPEGGVRWITAMGQVDGDAMGHAVLIRGVSMDVTELRQSQDRFRMIVEAVPSSVILADSQGRIVMANTRAEQCFGYERGDLVGRSIEELMPPQYRGAHSGLRAGFHADPSVRAMGSGRELSARRRDGSDFPVEISLSPLESPEGALVLAVIVDISARRQAEQESAMHRQELAHLARVSMLGELAGTIAHELNQPLAAMLSNSQVGVRMFESAQPDLTEIKAILDDIAADAKRAGGIIHGMRAMFKKDVVAEIQPVNMNEAVNQVLGLLHSEIVAKKAKVHLHLAKPLPQVMVGRVEIQQVLINLILNSLDAMKAAGNGNARIDISTEHQDGRVVVTVHDSGSGISEEILKRLFEAFATSKPGGLGLGLAISHGIVKNFGGELTGENHPEGGAVFRMILPGQVA
jgi:PAS domain S-box-containing protein